jgi:hypothetical protein
MTLNRCDFCGKYFQKLNVNKRCIECETQYHIVANKIMDRYSGAIKGFAKR